jgi:hypothetical protein
MTLGFEIRIRRDSLDHFPQQNRGLLSRIAATVKAGDGEKTSDQIIQAISLQVDAFQRAVGVWP